MFFVGRLHYLGSPRSFLKDMDNFSCASRPNVLD